MKTRRQGYAGAASALIMMLAVAGIGTNFALAGSFNDMFNKPRVIFDLGATPGAGISPGGMDEVDGAGTGGGAGGGSSGGGETGDGASPQGDPYGEIPAVVNIDTFWCLGDELAGDRALTASEIAASFETAAQYTLANSKVRIGQIRTRPIEWRAVMTTLTASEQDLVKSRPVLRVDFDDQPSKEVVNGLLSTVTRRDIVVLGSKEYAPNYIAVYVCSQPDTGRVYGHLFFQIRDSSLSEKVSRSIERIEENFLGLNVIKNVEIVGPRSPDGSELRYFYPDDQNLAARVAVEISKWTNLSVSPTYVRGYEQQIRQGTLEAWITQ